MLCGLLDNIGISLFKRYLSVFEIQCCIWLYVESGLDVIESAFSTILNSVLINTQVLPIKLQSSSRQVPYHD